MLRRIIQIAFGLSVGIAAWLLQPGHHAMGMTATLVLSLMGALGGELVAEKFLPADAVQIVGFVVSAIGALAMMLAYGIWS